MAKVRSWIGVLSAPILLISAGCSAGPRPFSSVHRRHAPERLMSIAQAYERQGQLAQAQNTYIRVLAIQPDHLVAQNSLNALMAKQNPLHQGGLEQTSPPPRELLADNGLNLSTIATRPVVSEPELAPLPPNLPAPASMTSGAAQLAELARQDAVARLATTAAPESLRPAHDSSSIPELSTIPTMVQVAVRIEPDLSEIPPAPIPAMDDSVPQDTIEPPENLAPIVIPPIDTTIVSIEPPKSDSATTPSTPSIATGIPVLPVGAPEIPKVIDASHHEVSTTQAGVPPRPESPRESLSEDVEHLEFVLPRIVNSPAKLPISTGSPSDQGWISANRRTAPPMLDASFDSTHFKEPRIAADEIANLELKPFFGPFHVQLIAKLRAHREEFQGQLIGLVTNTATNPDLRSRAIFLLGSIGPDARDALPAMQHELNRNDDVFSRMIVAESMLKIDHGNQAAIEQLIECLGSTEADIRWIATFALRNASSPHQTFVVDRLRSLLASDDRKVQRMVLLTLAEFGPSAAAARPEIEAALPSLDQETQEIARACLVSIVPDQKTTDNSPIRRSDQRLTHRK